MYLNALNLCYPGFPVSSRCGFLVKPGYPVADTYVRRAAPTKITHKHLSIG